MGDEVAGVAGARSAWTPAGRGRPTAQTKARREGARRRAVTRERRFRRAVRRHASCFYGLSRFQRRVLAIRTGVGAEHLHSRTAAGRRLEVSKRVVRRAERRGLMQLRRTNRTDGCAGAAARAVEALDLAFTALVEALRFDPEGVAARVGLPATGDPRPTGRGVAAGASESGGELPSGNTAGLLPSPDPDSTASDEGPMPLVAMLLACALLMAVIAATRRRRRAEASDGPVGDPWSETEGSVPPPPWSVPAPPGSVPPPPWFGPPKEAQEKPSRRDDRRALTPPRSSARRQGHPGRPGSGQPRKRD